jgi:hypothetical protein
MCGDRISGATGRIVVSGWLRSAWYAAVFGSRLLLLLLLLLLEGEPLLSRWSAEPPPVLDSPLDMSLAAFLKSVKTTFKQGFTFKPHAPVLLIEPVSVNV